MKKILSLLMLILVLPVIVNAGEIDYRYEHVESYGGEGDEIVTSSLILENEDFILTGSTSSKEFVDKTVNGTTDAFLIEFDYKGRYNWSKLYGGSGEDIFYKVKPTKDGGFVAVGTTTSRDLTAQEFLTRTEASNEGNKNAILVKYDKQGNVEWTSIWGGRQDDIFYDVIENSVDEFIAVGYTTSEDYRENMTPIGGSGTRDEDAAIVEFGPDGTLLQAYVYTERGEQYFKTIFESSDGEYVVTGSTDSKISSIGSVDLIDPIIFKFNKRFDTSWEKSLIGGLEEYFEEAKELDNGEYTIIGSTKSPNIDNISINGGYDAILVTYNENGEINYTASAGSYQDDYAYQFIKGFDNRIYAVGKGAPHHSYNATNSDMNAIFIAYHNYGGEADILNFGGTGEDEWRHISQYGQEEFVVAGTSTSNNIKGIYNKGGSDLIVGRLYIEGSAKSYYDLETKTDGNGEITTDRIYNEVEFKVIPKTGYKINTLTAIANGVEQKVQMQQDGSYYIELKADTELKATFLKDFNITLNETKNGKATAEQYEAGKGRVNAVPNEGYEVDTIVIKDTTGKEVVYEEKDGYYFFDVNDDLVITVTFKELPKEVVKGDEEEKEEENPKTADAFIYYACAVVCSLFGIWSVEQYRKTVKE